MDDAPDGLATEAPVPVDDVPTALGQAAPTFLIVGVGASAGGIEAMRGFFRGLKGADGLGIVVVTHLSPDRESQLHEVLGYQTGRTVHVATDGMTVERDNVYVLPADAVLGIEGGRLRLQRSDPTHRERRPIDVFLAALALDRGEAAAGVVLSGADSDGTLGLKAIQDRGGLTFAQVADGDGPRHAEMPGSAISAGVVDFALPAEQIGPRLAEFARGLAMLHGIAPPGEGPPLEARTLDDAREDICAILRTHVGHDFSGYKDRTFVRRVLRRMHILQLADVAAYLARLREDPQEATALFRDLLIGVTSFFRDADAFESLRQLVIPKLFEERGANEAVRVWVPACSTGEEVYSIAILLREAMDSRSAVPRVQIFATDIDERALAVARAARYPAALLESVSSERRQRFFVQDGSSFVVAKDVRELCVFSPHSVIRDPPFTRIDFVSCRNLLIYLAAEAQNQVLPVFHYALRPEGYLFLGTADHVGRFDDLFAPLDKKNRIFRARPAAGAPVLLPMGRPGLGPEPDGTPGLGKPGLGAPALRQAVEAQVLDHFAPAFVVVNRDGNVAHYSARTGRYLEPAAGTPTRQILAMARKGLRLDLRTALHEAHKTGATIRRPGIAVEGEDGRVQPITLTIERLRDGSTSEPLFVVLFEEEGPPLAREEVLSRVRAPNDVAQRLEAELRETRARVQSLIEQYETAMEELKSSNEELASVNEELQSSNEEMEASKEELQSLNEELHTVNAELGSKVEALDRANSDLQNLFASTDIATVFLDADLVIRTFTPAVAKVFNILPGDLGRPLTDLASRFSLPDLVADVGTVLATGERLERRVHHAADEAHYLVRLSPYRDGQQQVRGVVASFVDVTSITLAERQSVLIAELHHRTRNLLSVVQAIASLTLGKGGTVRSFTERLQALSRAQELVSRTGRDELDIGEIVRLELSANPAAADGRVVVSGPPAPLPAGRVQALALALHELATNATKYGALKQAGGRLSVTWQIVPDPAGGSRVLLDWRESGVTMPEKPPGHGYGRHLIERALALTLGTQAELTFGPDGVTCHLEVPLGPRPRREVAAKA